MKKLNAKGFSHVEILFVVMVILAITGIGYFIATHNSKSNVAHAGSWDDLTNNAGINKWVMNTSGSFSYVSRDDIQACTQKVGASTYQINFNIYREIKNTTVAAPTVNFAVNNVKYSSSGAISALEYSKITNSTTNLSYTNGSNSFTPELSYDMPTTGGYNNGHNVTIPTNWTNTGNGQQQISRGSFTVGQTVFNNYELRFQSYRNAVGYPNDLGQNVIDYLIPQPSSANGNTNYYSLIKSYYTRFGMTMPSFMTSTSFFNTTPTSTNYIWGVLQQSTDPHFNKVTSFTFSNDFSKSNRVSQGVFPYEAAKLLNQINPCP
jgi:hypothetical protein